LRHPNVIQFFGVCLSANKERGIVTELTDGDLLRNLMDKGIKKEFFLGICKDVAAGMIYLSSKKIVHRDLAARNILLIKEGTNEGTKVTAKVADFGLSAGSQTLQTTNLRLGTRWTAPEALLNDNWTEKSDVWSYGVVLFEIYSYGQHRPYHDLEDDKQVQKEVIAGRRPGHPDKCPEGICQIMDSCWERNPEDRKDFNWILKQIDNLRT